VSTEVDGQVTGTRKKSRALHDHRAMADRQILTRYLLFLKTAHQSETGGDRGSPKLETHHSAVD